MLTPLRFLAVSFGTTLALFVAVWAWIAAVPLAYMDPEYPYWLAKQRLLAACDLGDVLIVGDSRAAVDILPAQLGTRVTNLAVGGGQPVEAYVTLAGALKCPAPPALVVISIDATHFVQPDLFWERSVRYGLVGGPQLREVMDTAARLGDTAMLAPRRDDHLPAALRARLADIRFPTFYFSALLKGGVVLRWWRNSAALQAGIAARGQYFFGRAAASAAPAGEARLTAFTPMPVQDAYFDRLLALLQSRGIAAMFVPMPVNAATRSAVRPDVARDFAAYLSRYAARYPGFRVAGPLLPVWPDQYFGDDFGHLNPTGATRLSAGFDRLLAARATDGYPPHRR